MTNTFQTNSFTSGMNMDVDVNLIKDNQYRYAENVRIITNDNGTTGALQGIEGVRKYNGNITNDEVVIGATTIDKMAIIFTKVIVNGNYSHNKVYRVEGFDDSTPKQTVVLQGDLKLCEYPNETNISCVANYETDTNIKVYFTDGKSATKVINVVDGKYTGTSATNPLVDSRGWIKTPNAIDITPGAVLPPFKIIRQDGGNLASGVIQYCYQLFNIHGSESTLSSLSELNHLTASVTTQTVQQYEGMGQNVSSGKSCVLKAPLVSKDYQKCRIISLSYTNNNQPPRIFIVDEIDLVPTQSEINYIDNGNTIIGELSVEEFNALTGYQFIAKTLTRMDNRLFAANIQEDSWNPKYDARAYRCNKAGTLVLHSANSAENISKVLPTDATELKQFYDSIPESHDCINPFNTTKSVDFNDTNRYEYSNIKSGSNRLRGGSGPNIDYTFVTTDFKLDEMVGKGQSVASQDSVGIKCAPENISQVVLYNADTRSQEVVQALPAPGVRLPNYADPYLAANYRSYQRDEVYRFGIVFYNEKNIPSPVHWIGDIRFPHSVECPAFAAGSSNLQARPLGIKFQVRNVPAGCTSFEIVRCDRTEADRTILMQAAMSIVGNMSASDDTGELGGSTDVRPYLFLTYQAGDLTAVGFNGTDRVRNAFLPNNQVQSDYVTLISPEISFMQDKIEQSFKGQPTYVESLYGLVSQFDAVGGKPRIMMNALKVRDTDPNAGELTKVNKIGIVTDGSDGAVGVLVDDTSKAGQESASSRYALSSGISKYYRLQSSGNGSAYGRKQAYITDVKYPPMAPYNSINDKSPYYVNIGNIAYLNMGLTNFQYALPRENTSDKSGPFGPCLIAYIPGVTSAIPRFSSIGDGSSTLDSAYTRNAIPVVNIKKDGSQYGGNTFTSRQNSIYISTNSYSNDISGITHTLYTFGGDTYLCLLDQPLTMIFQKKDPQDWDDYKMFTAAYIPFESSINLNLAYGDAVHRSFRSGDNFLDIFTQVEPGQLGAYHVQDRPYFAYNPTYSSQPGSRKYISASIYAENNVVTSNRIACSEAKTNNEILDNWTKFKFANYLDVDNKYGQITNLTSFKDRLFFWQDTALGIASVNERSLIQDNNVGQLTLGTGGILTRADYLTNTNGSSIVNDRSIVHSDNVLYWYDFDKNEICAYTGQVSQISKEKGVQTYLNEMYVNKRNVSLAFYDKKYNEVWFKFYDKSLIFNEQLGQFTSFYTFNPQWALPFSNKIVTIKDNFYYVINTLDIDGILPETKIAKVQFYVNKDTLYTKVFDNVFFSGEFNDPSTADNLTAMNNIITNITFHTKSQEANPLPPCTYDSTVNTDLKYAYDYREDTYRFAIGRENIKLSDTQQIENKANAGRLRGKWLQCEYVFDCNNDKTFKLPYVNTTYRYSLV